MTGAFKEVSDALREATDNEVGLLLAEVNELRSAILVNQRRLATTRVITLTPHLEE